MQYLSSGILREPIEFEVRVQSFSTLVYSRASACAGMHRRGYVWFCQGSPNTWQGPHITIIIRTRGPHSHGVPKILWHRIWRLCPGSRNLPGFIMACYAWLLPNLQSDLSDSAYTLHRFWILHKNYLMSVPRHEEPMIASSVVAVVIVK